MDEYVRKRYLLTLYRQGVFYNNKNRVDMSVTAENNENQFFSTDYFDKLVVEEIGTDKDLAAFMGITHENGYDSDVIAVHNYSIFQDIETAKEDYVNAIFNNSLYPYLGLIHVYITPDVFARLQVESEIDYIQCFEKDLKQTVEKCNDLLDVNSVVFKMLSTSDFMVVVRSDCPEKIISIATVIRSRKLCEPDGLAKSLSVYKTYTIMTLNSPGDEVESGDLPTSVGKVAIRGRYSNQYWIGEKKMKAPEQLVHLHGRYDFLVYLEHNEFVAFYPLLCKVKGIKTNKVFIISDQDKEEKKYSEELCYLYELITQDYLSYLNERYLIDVASEF